MNTIPLKETCLKCGSSRKIEISKTGWHVCFDCGHQWKVKEEVTQEQPTYVERDAK